MNCFAYLCNKTVTGTAFLEKKYWQDYFLRKYPEIHISVAFKLCELPIPVIQRWYSTSDDILLYENSKFPSY